MVATITQNGFVFVPGMDWNGEKAITFTSALLHARLNCARSHALASVVLFKSLYE